MTNLITITNNNVEKHGFFCKMSARKSSAWKRKRAWLADRFEEGLQMRLLGDGERGFIEFTPGEFAWRGIENAQDYMIIHCLWVVGKSKGKGHAKALLDHAEAFAQDNGFKGIAALTSSGNWLVDNKILQARGYDAIDTAPPGYALMARSFDGSTPTPKLVGRWDKKAEALGDGLTVLHSAQCPYLEDAVQHAKDAAEEAGIPFTASEIISAHDLRARVPNPYGVFSMVLNGRQIASHYLLKKQIMPLLAQS
ncbi:GNAT family N-acetyltransferase [Aliiroseovarius sp. S253]|uniref:GNAT family N-acetyltransferase n=1 Tax=Aliiroseovarius sp. S253 TaxID=3415133 RepID=UPI003C7BB37F